MKPTELAFSEHKQLWNNFDASVEEALGPTVTISYFDYKLYTDLTPDLDYYEDFDENSDKVSLEEFPYFPATLKVIEKYLNIDLMPPHSSGEARGRVTKQALENGGNTMGNANLNPIIDLW